MGPSVLDASFEQNKPSKPDRPNRKGLSLPTRHFLECKVVAKVRDDKQKDSTTNSHFRSTQTTTRESVKIDDSDDDDR